MGITGGIGSGKSAACDILEGLGRIVVRADPLAREIMESNGSVRTQIIRVLGRDAYGPDGTLNRRRVANLIFADAGLRGRVNAIVHPAVTAGIRGRLSMLTEEQRSPFTVVEAALIYDSGLDSCLNVVVAIDAPLEVRLARVVSRDGGRRDDVLLRARAQLPVSRIKSRADFLIGNAGSLDDLKTKVTFLHSLLTIMSRGMEQNSPAGG